MNIKQNVLHKQPGSQILKPGQKVYLYGDRRYEGKLIRPLERTYPPKWTVKLDIGSYVAANVTEIFPLESPHSKPNELEIPFSEEPETAKIAQLEQKIRILENTIKQLEAENRLIEYRYNEVEQENQLLHEELKEAKQTIRRAKNISPILRLSHSRVLKLAHQVCMDVQKTFGGWILRMGDKARKFRRLADIWDLLAVDEFILSEILPPEKLIAIDKILPPKRKTRPEPREKETFPLMHPRDIIRNRTMTLVQSG
ncbi:MAG: hypothetical protein AAGA80_12810 [Cyanobacteria bacterium P01_F01_bin.143]